MKTITIITSRFARLTLAAMGLLLLCNTVSLAEGWDDNHPPFGAAYACNSSDVLYSDGSILYSDGTYYNSVYGTAHVSAAAYDTSGNLHYADGTILYPDGSWTPGGIASPTP